ncbi:MAG: hypothetical protein AAFY34_08505 [Pseudomonadota bacterium]
MRYKDLDPFIPILKWTALGLLGIALLFVVRAFVGIGWTDVHISLSYSLVDARDWLGTARDGAPILRPPYTEAGMTNAEVLHNLYYQDVARNFWAELKFISIVICVLSAVIALAAFFKRILFQASCTERVTLSNLDESQKLLKVLKEVKDTAEKRMARFSARMGALEDLAERTERRLKEVDDDGEFGCTSGPSDYRRQKRFKRQIEDTLGPSSIQQDPEMEI